MKIIYIHGFNSSGNSSKVEDLKKKFPQCKIVAPTLSANPNKAYDQIREEILNDYDNTILVGTSLGGFYALIFSCIFDIPCFLINPSLEPYNTLKKKVGNHIRFGSENDVYEFKPEYLEFLKLKSALSNPQVQNSKLINLYLANDDEQLDFSNLENFIPKANVVKKFNGAGHRFTKFDEVLKDIEAKVHEMKMSEFDDKILY